MFFSIQFFIYFMYFILRLYSLVDKFIIFSSNGTKLKKYMSNNNLLSMTDNLNDDKIRKIFYNLYNFLKSPKRYKKIILKILVSIAIIAIYLALTYNNIFSNFIYIKFFNKNICINNIFKENIIYIQIIFIFLFSFFVFDIVNNLFNVYSEVFQFVKKDNSKEISDDSFVLGNLDNKKIKIPLLGMYQNILITGSIGSGKTSSGITNILDYMLSKKIGGLVIDVKGNYINTVKKVATKYGLLDKIKEISLESDFVYNPLDRPNLFASELASNVVKALKLISIDSKNSDSYWLDKVESYIKDFIVLIRAYKDYVDFSEIHKLTINQEYLQEKIKEVEQSMLSNYFKDEDLYEIGNSISNIKLEYLKLDERTINIIRSEITRITAPFVANLSINSKFCKKQRELDLVNGDVIVLSLNIGSNRNLAKIISTYMKLDFQNQVLSRKCFNNVFFICDEYQEFANKEDANFFSLSREYKCINVVSMQSYSSLINALQDEYSARVIIQNLVNKIWFRNDDNYTISEIIKQIGKEKKEYKTLSISENSKESKYSLIFNRFKNIKSNLNESYSVYKKDEYLLNEEYFTRKLNTFEVVALLSDGNEMSIIKKVILKRWEEN